MAGDIMRFMAEALPRLEAEAKACDLSAGELATVLSCYLRDRVLIDVEPCLVPRVVGNLMTGAPLRGDEDGADFGTVDPDVIVEMQRNHHEVMETDHGWQAPPPLTREECTTVGEYRFLYLDEPIVKMGQSLPHLSYLTVGDGRYGREARLLRRLGVTQVMATDIASSSLKLAAEAGLLSNWQAENMEALSFANDSWDVVVCREALHHVPRAPIALMELIRVARHAVVLIEPLDVMAELGRGVPVNAYLEFESCGNFIYAPSRRDLMKAATSLQLAGIASKQICDYYDLDLCSQPPNDESVARWHEKIELYRQSVARGAACENYLFAILFKTKPDPLTLSALRLDDWSYWPVPRNPYLPG